jgi:hypothetical protein
MPRYKFLDTLVLVFVVVLLVSNLVAQKVCRLGPLTISGAELLFPITYIFGDVFTEVYGYQASRRAIWIGFFASALLSAAGAMAVALPADPGWHNQAAFEAVFGLVPRFVAASLIAYWVGEDLPSSARPSTPFLSWSSPSQGKSPGLPWSVSSSRLTSLRWSMRRWRPHSPMPGSRGSNGGKAWTLSIPGPISIPLRCVG